MVVAVGERLSNSGGVSAAFAQAWARRTRDRQCVETARLNATLNQRVPRFYLDTIVLYIAHERAASRRFQISPFV